MARYRVTVDTGGTFSDFVYLNEQTGEVTISKVPSTPDDPSRAILAGVESLCPVSADVRHPDAVQAALAAAQARFGDIDVLVSGAAGNFLAPALELSALLPGRTCAVCRRSSHRSI